MNTWTNNTSILNQESFRDSKAESTREAAALLSSSGLCMLVTDTQILGKHYIQLYVFTSVYVFSAWKTHLHQCFRCSLFRIFI